MRTMVGSSILKDSFAAGEEVARNSVKGLKTPKLGLLFSSIRHNQEDLVNGIKSICPEIKVIGCTSSGGVMTPDGIIASEEGFAGMMVLEDNELQLGVASSPRGIDPRTTGIKIAKEAMANAGKNYPPSAFVMFCSPRDEEQYIKGIQDVIGEVPIFGGSASDDHIVGDWKVIGNDKSFDDGCAIALLYTTSNIKTVYENTYKETEHIGIITQLDDERRIMEIDNVPALHKYAEWAGLNPDELIGQKLLRSSISKPLAVKNLNGDIILVRHPKAGNTDYSLTVGAKVVNKSTVMLLESDVDGLIEGAVKTIYELTNNYHPSGLLLIHSAERKLLIGDRIDEDYVAIKNAVGDLPFIVAFTSSEYGHVDHSGACVSNLSLSFTAFPE